MQSVRMTLADLHVDLEITSSYVDQCVLALNADELDVVTAAGVKAKATELQWRAVDTAMQLFGGSGYMEENPIARIWRDARVQRIYGGANEVLMDLVGRRLVAQ
jgi:alkylation response protein AidB-like acyl-CoA dehydrogenase